MFKKLWGALVMLLVSACAYAQQPTYSIFNDSNDLVSVSSFLASRGNWINHSMTPHQTISLTLPPNEPYGKIRVDTPGKGYVQYDISAGNAYRVFFNPKKQVLDMVTAKNPNAAPMAQPYQQQTTQQYQPQPQPQYQQQQQQQQQQYQQQAAPQYQQQAQANNPGIPMGPYQNSCQNISLSGNKANLFATCMTQTGGTLVTALLGVNDCQTPISNADGYLRCQMRSGQINQEIRVIYVNNRLQSTPIQSVLIKDPNGQQWGQYSTRVTNPNDRQMIWLERQLPCSLYVNVDQRQVALMDTCNKRQFWQFDQSYRID